MDILPWLKRRGLNSHTAREWAEREFVKDTEALAHVFGSIEDARARLIDETFKAKLTYGTLGLRHDALRLRHPQRRDGGRVLCQVSKARQNTQQPSPIKPAFRRSRGPVKHNMNAATVH